MEPQPLSQPVTIPSPRRTWTDAEWDKIRRAVVASHMQDQWMASAGGDRVTLHHASTGAAIYSARFRRELSGWRVSSAEVEGDADKYKRGTDEQESRALQIYLETLLVQS